VNSLINRIVDVGNFFLEESAHILRSSISQAPDQRHLRDAEAWGAVMTMPGLPQQRVGFTIHNTTITMPVIIGTSVGIVVLITTGIVAACCFIRQRCNKPAEFFITHSLEQEVSRAVTCEGDPSEYLTNTSNQSPLKTKPGKQEDSRVSQSRDESQSLIGTESTGSMSNYY